MKISAEAMMRLLAASSIVALSPTAAAAASFVGSWRVDQGPTYTVVPQAYSGVQAAALLFGGSASDYVISTAGTNESLIDNLTWVSTWGGACGGAYPCGTKVAENFVDSTGGLYSTLGDTSAYVTDWAIGAQYTNYAFRVSAAVPEPSTWVMMLLGFGAMGFSMRRGRRAKAIHQMA